MESQSEAKEYKPIEIGEQLQDWMRSPEGLSKLTSSWRTAIYFLKKTGYFDPKDYREQRRSNNIYTELKSEGYLLGVSFSVYSNVGTDTYEWHDGETVEHLSGEERYLINLHLAFSFHKSAADHYEALPAEVKLFLARTIWEQLADEEAFLKERKIGAQFNMPEEVCGFYPPEVEYFWNYSDGGVETSVKQKLNLVDDDDKLYEICKCTFPELTKVVKASGIKLDTSSSRPGFTSLTLALTRNEELLCKYLLEQGFIVSLEPKVLFPSPEVSNFREPDLLVFHKGRVIAIEIDDLSHLEKRRVKANKSVKIEANIDKWKRDRLLDRLFICNGIPVLRVWFTEVRESPEQVMTQVMQVFESLGGSRMNYL